MPKQVDHDQRRQAIAEALWQVVDQQGWSRATMREVAREAEVSLGQLQHYFSSRQEMLTFALDRAAEQTSGRVERAIAAHSQPPHPREALQIVLTEMLPLHADSRPTSRLQVAFVLEALHDPQLRSQARAGLQAGRERVAQIIRSAIADGSIPADRDVAVETDLLLAVTGLAPLLDLGVITPDAARTAIRVHLERLFSAG
ncbi:TetR/AcrR family transcriptional regulator [Microbacterium sp. CFH 90308]|uniref:TetR/AcrR family transcriptional regulator n=1 Tax=Microbacterium salsuginis TaxID=2722803 RepID=A0ABX1KD02_9MICO|nr:TetR/AcrR family transcriptional regulator [Microbacterium sp. CFH 90308]NLP84914.1 TetR/AcrR family transcriptional regulator [Microbacterium sp. CFH 90308]